MPENKHVDILCQKVDSFIILIFSGLIYLGLRHHPQRLDCLMGNRVESVSPLYLGLLSLKDYFCVCLNK